MNWDVVFTADNVRRLHEAGLRIGVVTNKQQRFASASLARLELTEALRVLKPGRHGGRGGWWWVVGDAWYYYPQPVYPYPDPYTPPVVVAPLPKAAHPT